MYINYVYHGKVLLGNNLDGKVVGIGTISIKMCDGIVKNSKQVKYVSELRRNLISLVMIDQSDCSIKAENGELKVIKNSMVIMKGVMRQIICTC